MKRVLVDLRAASGDNGHLFCMHHAGGAATFFRDWPRHLPPQLSVSAAVLPGRERRFGEDFHEDLVTAAEEVAAAIEESWPAHGNVILMGHSLGGLVAFEAVRRLEARALQPGLLVISGVGPLRRDAPARHEWTDEALVLLLRELGGTPAEVFESPELLNHCVRILRADLRLVDSYSPEGGASISTPTTAIGGAEDRNVGRAGLAMWKEYTNAAFATEVFPGGHFYLADHAIDVLRWLQAHFRERGLLAHPRPNRHA